MDERYERDEIVRKAYEQNKKTFSDEDRANARIALNFYLREFNGFGLRFEFYCKPSNLAQLVDRPQQHQHNIKSLRLRVKQFGEFIEILESFRDRSVAQLDPSWWMTDDPAKMITWTIEPADISTYRYIYEAFVAYASAVDSKDFDVDSAVELARKVACTINPNKWRDAGELLPEDLAFVDNLSTEIYLEVMLFEPKISNA